MIFVFCIFVMAFPKVIFLFSAKRKSGKDFICEKIISLLDEKCTIVRISGPLKSLYAKNHNLDLNELMSDGPYKERYRRDMINWSDEVRLGNPGYFCKAACDSAPLKHVWIVSDIRRKTDIKWFKETFPEKIKTVRIFANEDVRRARGWVFTKGVDDVASECDLDDYSEWDFQIKNNNEEELEKAIKVLLSAFNENTV